MERTNIEPDAVSSKIKVLAIGDKEKDEAEQLRLSKVYHEDLTTHLRYISMGTRKPIILDDELDLNIIGWFGASVHNENDIPKSYTFYYRTDNSCSSTSRMLIEERIFSGREIMVELKKRLCKENWISENTISAALKEKLDGYYHNRYDFIQQTVAEILDIERHRLFNYFLFLHREHVKHKQ